jgi:hypothetical protein
MIRGFLLAFHRRTDARTTVNTLLATVEQMLRDLETQK